MCSKASRLSVFLSVSVGISLTVSRRRYLVGRSVSRRAFRIVGRSCQATGIRTEFRIGRNPEKNDVGRAIYAYHSESASEMEAQSHAWPICYNHTSELETITDPQG